MLDLMKILASDQKNKSSASRKIYENPFILITSGKGGVGKSFISVALAHFWAKKGEKVLLFDGDLGAPNIDWQLGWVADKNLDCIIKGQVPMTKALTTCLDYGFDVISGQSQQLALSQLPIPRLSLILNDLKQLASGYHRVVVDVGGGSEKKQLKFIQMAGRIIVVLNSQSLAESYTFIKMVLIENPQMVVQVIVNQAASSLEGEYIFETLAKACEKFLGRKIGLIGIIRCDEAVPKAIQSHKSVLDYDENSPVSEDIKQIGLIL